MSDSVSIQVVDSHELALLRAMLDLFGRAFDDAEAYASRPPGDEYLRSLLSRDDFVAIAALVDGTVVGGLAGYVLHKFEQERSEFYIYDLAVDAAHRRRGVATAMIEKLKGIARQRGAYVIYVQADHGDDTAIALYTRLGTREDALHFDIEPN